MKPLMTMAFALAALSLCGSAVYRPPEPAAACLARCREKLGIYDGYATPTWVLRGIARAESGECDSAIGDDGISLGRCQLNSRYAADRARAWGRFDPFQPNDAIRVASCILQENLRELGSWDLAIAAYRQGVAGVLAHGAASRYSDRVMLLGAAP